MKNPALPPDPVTVAARTPPSPRGEEPDRSGLSVGRREKLAMLEALLFAAEEPLDESAVAAAIPDILEVEVGELVGELERLYRVRGQGIGVQRVAGGWRLATRPEYEELIRRHLRSRIRSRLSRAALETISIIAYRQPVGRAEIELIRGVDCSPVLRHLLERGLIRVTGRAETPGRPLLYGTTDAFLAYFGLDSLAGLPKPEEILGEPEEEPAVEWSGEAAVGSPEETSRQGGEEFAEPEPADTENPVESRFTMGAEERPSSS